MAASRGGSGCGLLIGVLLLLGIGQACWNAWQKAHPKRPAVAVALDVSAVLGESLPRVKQLLGTPYQEAYSPAMPEVHVPGRTTLWYRRGGEVRLQFNDAGICERIIALDGVLADPQAVLAAFGLWTGKDEPVFTSRGLWRYRNLKGFCKAEMNMTESRDGTPAATGVVFSLD